MIQSIQHLDYEETIMFRNETSIEEYLWNIKWVSIIFNKRNVGSIVLREE